MQTLEMTGFKSVNEVVSPEKQSPDELVALDNMRLDEEAGIATTRKGFARYNTDPVVGVINNLFDIEDINSNNYLLASIGTKLRKSLNGTGAWADIKTGLTSAKMRMAAYGDKFIFTNGVDSPFYTDLVTASNPGIDKPDVSAITGVVVEGINVIPADARYIIIYVTSDGQKSNASNRFRILDGNGAINYTSVTLNDLPVSLDDRVITKRIFRTKKGVYDTFYLLGEIDNSVTTYLDIITDATLNSTETIEYLNNPDKAKYILSNGERIFLAYLTKKMTNRIIPPVQIYDYGKNGGGGGDGIWISDAGGGSMSIGIYKYAVSFVDTNGNESELVTYFEHELTGTDSKLSFYMLDYPIDNYDYTTALFTLLVGIKSVRLYRTKANGSVYYWHSDISVPVEPVISFPSIIDVTADADLTIVSPKETVHNSNEVAVLPSSVIYSNLNNFIEFPELNYYEVYPDDSEKITGFFDDDNGVVIFKEQSICKTFTVDDSSNWQTQKLVENMGCDQPDTIYKYQNSYFFVFRNKVYLWGGQGEPKCISYKRKPTFDSVTEFLGATFYNSVLWYVLTVKIDSDYYLLCYDTKLETWYKFSINKADTVFEKKFGADKGKLLIGGNLYLTYYNESQVYDNDSGVITDIAIRLKTKDYTFPDNFVVARLMDLFLNYTRLINTIAKQIMVTLSDPVTGYSKNLIDDDETVLQNIYKISTDGMNGSLQRCNKINLSVEGQSLSKFYAARLDYLPETWGVRRKSTIQAEGIGMSHGSKFGTQE